MSSQKPEAGEMRAKVLPSGVRKLAGDADQQRQRRKRDHAGGKAQDEWRFQQGDDRRDDDDCKQQRPQRRRQRFEDRARLARHDAVGAEGGEGRREARHRQRSRR